MKMEKLIQQLDDVMDAHEEYKTALYRNGHDVERFEKAKTLYRAFTAELTTLVEENAAMNRELISLRE